MLNCRLLDSRSGVFCNDSASVQHGMQVHRPAHPLTTESQRCLFRYLENYVSRVTTRLTQMHQEQGKKGYIDADPDEAIASASRASGTGELKWDQVQPLLTEYDEMIYTLQTKLTERQEELGRFEVKLDDISKENAALVGKLKHVLQEEVTMVSF